MSTLAPAAERLVTAPGLRRFAWAGREYAHVSAAPLPYLGMGPALARALDLFAAGRAPAAVAAGLGVPDGAPRRAFGRFAADLLTAGVLRDPADPSPPVPRPAGPDTTATLWLFPTNGCNLGCVYCYASSGPSAGPQMAVDVALRSVDAFLAGLAPSVEHVRLSFHGGGEPMTALPVLTAATRRLQDGAAERGLTAGAAVITNGVVGAEGLAFLTAPGVRVSFSYDGPLQDRQRPTAGGRATRERVRETMRAVAAAGKRPGVRATLTHGTLDALPELVADVAALGMTRLQVETASTVGRGGAIPEGPPDPTAFAGAFLDAFRLGLELGVRVETAGLSILRQGDGAYCGAVRDLTGITPGGHVSRCVEASRDADAGHDPFLVGRVAPSSGRHEIWPERDAALRTRRAESLPDCRTCFAQDTCAGGCMSRARAQTGTIHAKDAHHCVVSHRVNPQVAADIADGRLVPEPGWLPYVASLAERESGVPGLEGRLVALVPREARRAWLADPARRPLFPVPPGSPDWFRAPAG